MKLEIKSKAIMGIVLCTAVAVLVADVEAQIFVYPKGGQDQKTQMKDTQECQAWAMQQTGYNPSATVSAPSYTSSGPKQGSGLKGAAVGALGGAAIGGISDGDVGKAAAVGAIGGAVVGRMRSRRQEEEIAAAQNRAVSEVQSQGYGSYEKACKACLEGRGYTVS